MMQMALVTHKKIGASGAKSKRLAREITPAPLPLTGAWDDEGRKRSVEE